jgi:hypothetical protein
MKIPRPSSNSFFFLFFEVERKMSKYMQVRNRYRFEQMLENVPTTDPAATSCLMCKGRQYALFATEYTVIEGSVLPNQPRIGTRVRMFTCAKCLKYIHNQPLQAFSTQMRTSHYHEKFPTLIAWCTEHADVTETLPTLRQFMHLVAEGKQFKPALVTHVAALIETLRRDSARMNFVRWLATLKPQQITATAEHLKCRVDTAERLSDDDYEQVKRFASLFTPPLSNPLASSLLPTEHGGQASSSGGPALLHVGQESA